MFEEFYKMFEEFYKMKKLEVRSWKFFRFLLLTSIIFNHKQQA